MDQDRHRLNGTTLGHNYGTVGPDVSTMGGVCRTAFYLNGYLYDGATTAANASTATIVGVNTADRRHSELHLHRRLAAKPGHRLGDHRQTTTCSN